MAIGAVYCGLGRAQRFGQFIVQMKCTERSAYMSVHWSTELRCELAYLETLRAMRDAMYNYIGALLIRQPSSASSRGKGSSWQAEMPTTLTEPDGAVRCLLR